MKSESSVSAHLYEKALLESSKQHFYSEKQKRVFVFKLYKIYLKLTCMGWGV